MIFTSRIRGSFVTDDEFDTLLQARALEESALPRAAISQSLQHEPAGPSQAELQDLETADLKKLEELCVSAGRREIDKVIESLDAAALAVEDNPDIGTVNYLLTTTATHIYMYTASANRRRSSTAAWAGLENSQSCARPQGSAERGRQRKKSSGARSQSCGSLRRGATRGESSVLRGVADRSGHSAAAPAALKATGIR